MSEGQLSHEKQMTPKQRENGAEPTRSESVFFPQVDIVESPDRVLLVADMPGVDEANVDVSIERNRLTIRGHVTHHVPEGFRPLTREYNVGDYERTFTIADEIDRDNVEATVKNGVLRLRLPKAKQALSRKVSVKAG